jgi:methyl-galactoside transport system substrate-binding protein
MSHARQSMVLAVLVTGMIGCTKSCTNSSTSETGQSSSGEKPVVIGAAIYKYEDTFMTGVRNAISLAAEGKARVDFVDSANQQPVQSEKVDLFIAKGVNAMAINPVDRTAAGVIVDKAKAANIPVVFFNREPLPEDMKKWDKVFYVGAKAEESGTLAGEIIAEYWKTHPEADRNKDGVLQYVMITGEPGHQDAELRSKYSVKALEDAGIKTAVIASDTGMWDRIKGQEKMAAFIGAKGDGIEAVIANNDDMALGAIEALKAAGYFKDGRFVPVVGVDATAPALKALEDGTLLGTVLNDAKTQGEATFTLAYTLAQGKMPDKTTTGLDVTSDRYVWVAYKKVTKANMKDLM